MSDTPSTTAEQLDAGAIVLKARRQPTLEALAQQLAWFAEFGDAFHNRYEGGYAIKGQVRAEPGPDAPDHAALTAQIIAHAAQIGEMQAAIERLQRELAVATERAAWYKKSLDLLQNDAPRAKSEHYR